MILFKPQVQLTKITDVSEPDDYYVHVITFTDCTNYRADGYSIGEMDEYGTLPVTIRAVQDENIIDFNYLTPVVHTIKLGAVSFPSGGGLVEVTFDDGTQSAENGKKGNVRPVDAEEDARPLS
ncbi:MAG: hypothetical protein H6557_26055 [Lewinellaceae bacterium]|nr:hypothetical protein [Phaeodactylibacter sp.]MCB9040101.1 hypothetical protein [Lewinellaceae bacterium]